MEVPVKYSVLGLIAAISLNVGAGAQTREAANAGVIKLEPVPAELQGRSEKLHAVLKPTAASWVEQQAKIEEKRPAVDVNALEAAIRQRFASSLAVGGAVHPDGPVGPGGSGADIAAMTVLVMMQMVEDGDQDLQEKMAEAQAQMQAKQALRQLLNQANAEVAAAKARPAGASCTSALCQSLPSRFGEIAAMTAKQQKPVRLQAPAHITNGQLATVASEISNTLDSENEISEMGSMQLQMLMDTRSKLLQAASNMEKSMSDTDAAIVANMK